ncbi:mannose-1-phosphate guanylyltransferase/mannose-6-phosphate isomerase [Noviherbaspirillum aridicola]|uniref:mannose-1-phosphate guanylyltransferase n=1 Tax=Noviherbaspirillum aridicola TaxID=2849687 RepID=A0ABQ4Q734_9BURK|nr:mannose-1-phosphate guanylyltransferase/mannose-6-phosphate isomerase [Noviherbaspirillum aridicola]GIZ52519.1 xanthan biosynthesis protein XanB [Noviherbaspirillum aridicola]
MTTLYPVILSGGSGTRLWPLSRAALPKQYQPLVSDKTMLQETVLRTAGIAGVGAPLLVCANEHRFLAADQLSRAGVTPLDIILEPQGKNTAPAVTVAAQYLLSRDPDAVMLVMPADHVVGNLRAFEQAVAVAFEAARNGALALFGIQPDTPETGYGYIRKGKSARAADGCFLVDRFVEKPVREEARRMLDAGDYLWNSGMFMFRADAFLAEIRQFRPDIAQACEAALAAAARDLDFCRLDAQAFAQCPSDSIDYAVMERTTKAVVVPADLGWSDVGSWQSLAQAGQADGSGNVVRGDVHTVDVSGSMIRSESRLVAAVGVQDLVIVETRDAVLVAHKNESQRIKQVVDDLKSRGRVEHESHTVVHRPWGCYESIDAGHRYQVKRIVVKPGAKLSSQMHHHRAEHWIVVSGTALVTRGDEVKLLTENESTYIPIGVTHRLENPGKLPLHLIEVQSGSYLGEDDIVRFEDDYRRT